MGGKIRWHQSFHPSEQTGVGGDWRYTTREHKQPKKNTFQGIMISYLVASTDIMLMLSAKSLCSKQPLPKPRKEKALRKDFSLKFLSMWNWLSSEVSSVEIAWSYWKFLKRKNVTSNYFASYWKYPDLKISWERPWDWKGNAFALSMCRQRFLSLTLQTANSKTNLQEKKNYSKDFNTLRIIPLFLKERCYENGLNLEAGNNCALCCGASRYHREEM